MTTPLLDRLSADRDFCRRALPLVSRTFAINIEYLKTGPEKLYWAVLCGYLFCRIIDTVEDSVILSFADKIKLLEKWSQFFPAAENWEQELSSWIEQFNPESGHTDNSHEIELISNASRVFHVFHALGKEVMDQVSPHVKEMALGMASFQKKGEVVSVKPVTLEDLRDLEEYCYYVAGTVGNMLRDLFFYFHPEISESSRNLMNQTAVSFGLGLQMTNIIKDFYDDGKRDWCFIPKKLLEAEGLTPQAFLEHQNSVIAGRVLLALIREAHKHLRDALNYSLAIPSQLMHLRIFCLLPLHFAMETLAEARKWAKAPRPDKIKISRSQVGKTMIFTRWTYRFDFVQRGYFNRISRLILR